MVPTMLKDGVIVENTKLTFDPEPSLLYAYCSDTMYYPALCDFIKGADLLYHEATFANDSEALAKKPNILQPNKQH